MHVPVEVKRTLKVSDNTADVSSDWSEKVQVHRMIQLFVLCRTACLDLYIVWYMLYALPHNIWALQIEWNSDNFCDGKTDRLLEIRCIICRLDVCVYIHHVCIHISYGHRGMYIVGRLTSNAIAALVLSGENKEVICTYLRGAAQCIRYDSLARHRRSVADEEEEEEEEEEE